MTSERRQNLARAREIAQVAARYGFGQLFGRSAAKATADAPEVPGTRGRRLRDMLDELGPTFVKFGQLMSTRPDIVPPDIVEELRQLQDRARPEPFANIRLVVEAELGLTIEQVFTEFDEEAIAAASIGQVHRARLPSGDEVVVKVQRPDAERQINADIQLLYQLARMLKDRVDRLSFIDLVALVDEFSRSIRRELDYGVEAHNADTVRRNFIEDPHVDVPKIFWRYTTARVLVMERIQGSSLAQLALDDWSDEERRQLATRLAETWMQMVFVQGFFHADPHQANILVQAPDHIGLVDFGMVGQLSQHDREAAVGLLIDVLDLNADALPRRLRELGLRYPRQREQELADQLAVVLQRYGGQAMGDIDARAMLSEIFQTVYRLKLTLPTRWVMLDKTLATLGGVALQLSPDFNVFESARPYARRLMAERLRPDRVAERARRDLERGVRVAREFPLQVGELLAQLNDGEFAVGIHVDELAPSVERLERSVNRLVLALLAFGLMVSSAIVGALAHTKFEFEGIALVSFLPGIFGFFLIIWLTVGILRSGRW
jgi:ubiquinone biosynthesis protein